MGMTLIGQDPSKNTGKVIHFSMWVWHPMVEYLEKNHYDLLKDYPSLRFNSGEFSKDFATQLHDALDVENANEWSKGLAQFLQTLPTGPCFACLGFGKKRNGLMDVTDERCLVCLGTGECKQYVSQYYFRGGDLWNFKEFLCHCGGFRLT